MRKQLSEKERKRRGNIVGIISAGVFFAIYSMIFHPSNLPSLLLAGGLTVAVGAITRIMGQGLDTSKNQKNSTQSPIVEEIATNTGNPQIDELLEKGRTMIADIHTENNKISDIKFSSTISNLEGKLGQIFKVIYEQPEKAPKIRKFMNYYLPTTLKMLQRYNEISKFGLKGDNVEKAKERIVEAVGIVEDACNKQLDMLYHDDMLDITTDIEALQQMLKRDGLVDSDWEKLKTMAQGGN